MRSFLTFLFVSVLAMQSFAQQPTPFAIELEEVADIEVPALQSFAVARDAEGRWLLIGGRTDGLHKRRPFESFLPAYNNTDIFVVDLLQKQVWSAPLATLSTSLREQLQSTNMEFVQVADELYLFGGYGYSPTALDHITHPYLTTVEITPLANAIVNGQAMSPYIHQLEDARFQVTGGYAGYLEGTVFLVGGQQFMGRYNPMGPGHGPGFVQEYTNAIKRFELAFDGSTTTVSSYEETIDSAHFHRRDYNLVPQVFPDGSVGFTAFSGVFQYDIDLPWLNSVDIKADTYKVRNDFSQYLNQYHTAHLPIHDASNKTMHTLFFGGIGRYTIDPNTGELVDDQQVPFVKTISRITRYANDSVAEFEMPLSMPGFLGASAEFIPANEAYFKNGEILKLDALPKSRTLVGYIFGGIESTRPNTFFSNQTGLTNASDRVFEVYIDKSETVGLSESSIGEADMLSLKVAPNPASNLLTVDFYVTKTMELQLYFIDTSGKVKRAFDFGTLANGSYRHSFHVEGYSPGMYLLKLTNGAVEKTVKVVVE